MLTKLKELILEKNNRVLLNYSGYPEQVKAFKLITQIRAELTSTKKKETDFLMQHYHAINLYNLAKEFSKLDGEFVEVGTYSGGSAKIMAIASGRHIYTFDTFEGLPSGEAGWKKLDYHASFPAVKEYLKNYATVYKGLFPKNSEPIDDKKFAFVHLDVDIYQSTKDCLEFFYPRMVKGGGIFSHDYFFGSPVYKAFHEFFKKEVIIEFAPYQCLVIPNS